MIKPYAVQAKVKAQLVLSLRNDEKANKKNWHKEMHTS